jgi:hypothetical protein
MFHVKDNRERRSPIAPFVAWALVSLPGVGQRFGNNNFHTAVPPNPASGTAHPAATATAATPASSSSTVSQPENITSRPDDEETSTLIELGQDFSRTEISRPLGCCYSAPPKQAALLPLSRWERRSIRFSSGGSALSEFSLMSPRRENGISEQRNLARIPRQNTWQNS